MQTRSSSMRAPPRCHHASRRTPHATRCTMHAAHCLHSTIPTTLAYRSPQRLSSMRTRTLTRARTHMHPLSHPRNPMQPNAHVPPHESAARIRKNMHAHARAHPHAQTPVVSLITRIPTRSSRCTRILACAHAHTYTYTHVRARTRAPVASSHIPRGHACTRTHKHAFPRAHPSTHTRPCQYPCQRPPRSPPHTSAPLLPP